MGKYVIEATLGQGGMAEVFRARVEGAEGFSRPVALKRVAPFLSRDKRFADMFVAEARMAALLHHPNIVSVLDFDRDEEGALFLAMELVDGADLRRIIEAAATAGRRIPPGLSAYLCAEVLKGLQYAHDLAQGERQLGLVHRDVSPHNVLVSRAGSVKIADFGIAKATAAASASVSGTVKGKLVYMAPEQASGADVDGRTDQYAVGIMLYELLAGSRPYDGASEPETLARILNGKARPVEQLAADAPPDLAAVTMRMFSRDAADRFPNAAHAAAALRSTTGFPTHGDGELAALVKELVPPPPPARTARELVGSGVYDAVVVTQPTVPGKRARSPLWLLALLAAFAVTAAVVVWFLPPSAPVPAPVVPVPAPAPVPTTAVERPRPVVPPPPSDPSTSPRRPSRPAAAPSATPGTLFIKVVPWAHVTVDDQEWGVTPVKREISAGKHRLKLVNPDLSKHETMTVEVVSGQTKLVDLRW